MVPEPGLEAIAPHRWLGGSNYRKLWASEIQVEVLDFKREAGGLTPKFRVGGLQTPGLAISGNNGKSYTFRSLVKDLSESLPEGFEGTAVAALVQDALSAAHPAGAIVTPPLASAAGVLHNTPRFVVLPDDPALGEFRKDFAGRLGTFEEYPTPASETSPGFAGATEIIATKKIWPKLLSGEAQIDSRAFLRARLFDFLIGDWDRHVKQFRWAKLPGKTQWQPLPEDRDWAFADYEGAIPFLIRPFQPTMVLFQEDYASLTGMTMNGADLIRWLLPQVEKSEWNDIASDLQRRITDEVIDEAVGRMPKPWQAKMGGELRTNLRARRDRLPELARELYAFMAEEVDLHATDLSDKVELFFLDDGGLEARITPKGHGRPITRRVFTATETNELRIYLHGDSDTVTCNGPVGKDITLRVIADPLDHFGAQCLSQLEVVDAQSLKREGGFTKPDPRQHFPEVPALPEPWRIRRDWGHTVLPALWLNVGSDYGLLIGGGVQIDQFAFGRTPFAVRHLIRGGYAAGVDAGSVEYHYERRFRNPRWSFRNLASATGIEVIRFYGFGNETSSEGSDDFFQTEQMQYFLRPQLRFSAVEAVDFFIDGQFKFSDSDEDDDTLLNELSPEGVGDYTQLNVGGGIDIDTRDKTKMFSPGVHLRLEGHYFPAVFSVDEQFASAEAELGGYWSPWDPLLIATRVHGKTLFGDFPFHEAAFVGGSDSVRGYRSDRFAGRSGVFGNLEFRFVLGNGRFLLPAEYGLVAFGDIGRVFQDDEDSSDWHPAAGGGLFASLLERSLLANATIARSEERTVFFVKTRFVF